MALGLAAFEYPSSGSVGRALCSGLVGRQKNPF